MRQCSKLSVVNDSQTCVEMMSGPTMGDIILLQNDIGIDNMTF